ncbi:MAG: type I restriction-modification system DNA methylase subunit [Limisphaerales bacterium]|jgi:type I restriction-modification system DNA methylase subunit
MKESIDKFVKYTSSLDGDEKGEAQVFCDRFFQAFGHDGYKEAGATLEFRVKSKKKTNFADLLWEDRVLIEMKKRGAQLPSHRTQIFDYWWKLRPNQPKYSILCNFDEFIIYDFASQDEPLDRIQLEDLPDRYTALNFMLPKAATPVFENNLEEATRETADLVAAVFNSMLDRGEDRGHAQRFILQAIFTMFAEDYHLLPKDIFTQILKDCKARNGNSYDLINGLFLQMDNPDKARGGRFKNVDYFNGGLFSEPEAIELNDFELETLHEAATKRWNKVNPAIFGTIFQSSMGKEERHAFGAHYTSELDILKIVQPAIIQPWRDKITKAKTLREMKELRKELFEFKVLDPACGSGNFLYVAYRELKRIEMELLNKIHTEFPRSASEIGTQSIVSIKQFHGMDYNKFAVELSKVTLHLAKEISIKETKEWVDTNQTGLSFQMEETLPLDNMDENILFADALFTDWVKADVIIGNPPYLDARKLTLEHGAKYKEKLAATYPEIPGRADYCVYWFKKAHDNLDQNGRAGLVGTNTIRQNYSREGGLDYIVRSGGTIFDAIGSQYWSGDAAVYVSIVNWIKGDYNGTKRIQLQTGDRIDSPWIQKVVDFIPSSLSLDVDVTGAKILKSNKLLKLCFEGIQPGHTGFRIDKNTKDELLRRNAKNAEVIFPYLNGRALLTDHFFTNPSYIIDLRDKDIFEASTYKEALEIIRNNVLPDWEKNAAKEFEKTDTKSGEHQNRLKKWWVFKRGRDQLVQKTSAMSRYIACSRVTKRNIFEFLDSNIRPDSSLNVFTLDDNYSFGIISSSTHWEWWKARGSTLKGDYRYTGNSVWDTFPFPQNPTLTQVKKVAKVVEELRDIRNQIMIKHNYSLRDLYRILEEPGANPLKDAHQKLDDAVLSAYDFGKRKDILTQLLELNFEVADKVEKGEEVQNPGLPKCVKNKKEFVSEDCVKMINE